MKEMERKGVKGEEIGGKSKGGREGQTHYPSRANNSGYGLAKGYTLCMKCKFSVCIGGHNNSDGDIV